MDTLIGQRIDPQYEGRDPLQEVVDAAHEEGLAVVPWFEFGFSSSYQAEGGRFSTNTRAGRPGTGTANPSPKTGSTGRTATSPPFRTC